MAVLHFDPELTEEELLLKSKFEKLRRKKLKLKKLTSLASDKIKDKHNLVSNRIKKGDDISPNKSLGVSNVPVESRVHTSAQSSSNKNSPTSMVSAKSAKEAAAKILKSAAIKNKSISKDSKENNIVRDSKSCGFKRSQGLERKLSSLDARAAFQPFSATHGPTKGFDTCGEDLSPAPKESLVSNKSTPKLYETFMKEKKREARTARQNSDGKPNSNIGNTIYVFGYNITEQLVRSVFQEHGNLINVNVETSKNCAFVTYDNNASAQQAIDQRNNSLIENIQLKVSMARRQPVIDPVNSAASSAAWSTIAANHNQKGSSHKDKRHLRTYEDENLF